MSVGLGPMSRKTTAGKTQRHNGLTRGFLRVFFVFFLSFSTFTLAMPQDASAQSYRFSAVEIEGNQRVEAGTILSYAGIARGETISAAALNDAYQRIQGSGLFETVEIEPRGGTLVIRVVEYPTINRIAIEGNKRLKDEDLMTVLRSAPRRVYSPTVAEADAAAITEAYTQAGRYAATVTPKIIRRSENRVDLVFEVTEGRVTEIERLSFVGNRAFTDRRLRRVLETKQAGFLRALIRSDTFIEDRIEFDKQVLRDFYLSRGYVDFQTLSVTSELARERDGFFITFTVREGQSFDFGEVTVTSDLAEVDPDLFLKEVKIRSGKTYSPTAIETTIARLERLAIKQGLDFIRVEPRITRNDRDLTLDVEFILSKGPRVFVERIDVEGNTTTLDRVVRRQFKVVEGDPFNPREIRETAERIRALGYFSNADVQAREGSAPDQVIVDVDVEEAPTGSFSFGAAYSTDSGAGFTVGFSERNFLGRGQRLSFSINTSSDDRAASFTFVEPFFLGRDLQFGLSGTYQTSEQSDANYDLVIAKISPSITFPVSENGRLSLRYTLANDKIENLEGTPSAILVAEEAQEDVWTSSVGYTYSFDSRRTGLDPNSGVVFRFGQDFAGLGGDNEYIRTTATLGAETKVLQEEVTLRAVFEGGALSMLNGDSRITDRFRQTSRLMRGFEPNGMGPREPVGTNEDALGGNFFAVARFEADFPLGLPEEYGISGGVFFDVGSIWGLDNLHGEAVDDDLHWRSVIGFAIYWDTALGPLRFNFTKALEKEEFDRDRSFELTISTTF